MPNLLTESRGNTKLRKSEREEYRILGLSLWPGAKDICSHATKNCVLACVGRQGLVTVFSAIETARKRKLQYFRDNRKQFEQELCAEIEYERRLAEWNDQRLVIRMNVYSDIDWSHIALQFPDVTFYDYTKVISRWNLIRCGYWPRNYFLTFSRSEMNEMQCSQILRQGANVSVVFANPGPGHCGHGAYRQQLPGFWTIGGHRYPVHDGDGNHGDLRFLDPTCDDWRNPTPGRGWIVGLRLKSHSEADRRQAMNSGFAVVFTP